MKLYFRQSRARASLRRPPRLPSDNEPPPWPDPGVSRQAASAISPACQVVRLWVVVLEHDFGVMSSFGFSFFARLRECAQRAEPTCTAAHGHVEAFSAATSPGTLRPGNLYRIENHFGRNDDPLTRSEPAEAGYVLATSARSATRPLHCPLRLAR
jgi:hypothetical protein